MSSMQILLIQIDGKWPNLALMKLSKYHKVKGDKVCLIWINRREHYGDEVVIPDKVYVSCIFTKNRATALGMAQFYRTLGAEVITGGSGINLKVNLPEEVENQIPDYELFGLDYSIGFSSRGCIRHCKPCIVPEKEGYIRETPLNWIVHQKAKLLDNNFLASPNWKQKLREFRDRDIEICMTQAFDIRLVNEEVAKELSETKSRNNLFTRRCYYFAFDSPELEPIITEKLALLQDNGIRPYCQLYYVLVGYNTTHEQDLHRVEFLHKKGCMAFVMKYHNNDPWLNKLANWCNGRYYKVCEFKDYDKHKYHEKQKTAEDLP